MEKPKSFKKTMSEIKTQFKQDQKRNNEKFKTDREQNKLKTAEQKEKVKETARLKQQQQQQVQSAPVVLNTPVERPARAQKKPKTKPRRKSSLDTSGGKNDVFNLFAQMLLGLIMSIPLFLMGLFAIIFLVMLGWSMIFE